MVGQGWREAKLTPQPCALTPPHPRKLDQVAGDRPLPPSRSGESGLLRALRRLPAAVGVIRGGPASSLPPLLSCFSRSWGPTEVAAAAARVRLGSY